MAMNESDNELDDEEMYYIGGFGIVYTEQKSKNTELTVLEDRVFPYIEQDSNGDWWKYLSENEGRVYLGKNYVRNEYLKKAALAGSILVVGGVFIYPNRHHILKITKDAIKNSTDSVIKVVKKVSTERSSWCTIL
jgi:hypothetical protein